MKKEIAGAISSFLAILSSFLPLAISEQGYYVNIFHVKGMSFFLPIFAAILMILFLIKVYAKEFNYFKVWVVFIGVLALLMGGVVISNSIKYLYSFSNMFVQIRSGEVSAGYGGIMYEFIVLSVIFLGLKKD